MIRFRLLAVSILSFLLAPRASAQGSPDGNQLLRLCGPVVVQWDGGKVDVEQAVGIPFCIGYVSGVLDGLAILGYKGGPVPLCMPKEGISNEQAVRIVVKFLRDNPEVLNETARMITFFALVKAFPCK